MTDDSDAELFVYDAPGDALWLGLNHTQLDRELRLLQARSQRRYDEAPAHKRAITWGDYFVRDWVDPYSGEALRIYGRVETVAEIAADEDPAVVEALRAQHAQGFRYGRHYSTREPTGEWGSTHVADITKAITAAEFEAARKKGWE